MLLMLQKSNLRWAFVHEMCTAWETILKTTISFCSTALSLARLTLKSSFCDLSHSTGYVCLRTAGYDAAEFAVV